MQNKLAIISGGTRGLGKELSLELGRMGYYVVALFRSDEIAAKQLEQELKQMNYKGRSLKWDITTETHTTKIASIPFLDEAEQIVLINNASSRFEPTPMKMLELNDFQAQLDVAIRGSFELFRLVMKPMARRKNGTVVNVLSSVVEGTVPKGFSAYATTKYALLGWGKSLASEYRSLGIRVFSVSPSFMDTPLTKSWSPTLRSRIRSQFDKILTPRQVAKKICRLILDESIPGKGEDYQINDANLGAT